ncbi:pilus assembly protein PilB [Cephaloticoccus capnophilus]|uniref:Pilus assembly protein PilB n=1 Tax=Cephaloticoccus capnophilus TaxID=1548208 RepID=A0A139SN85_9BACT|nr:GspE/PulE family protein [Cephaloticoccus capnophilus]KXU36025.1 pilus assembly protein PilB [Cephaloticoccus capnophilus]
MFDERSQELFEILNADQGARTSDGGGVGIDREKLKESWEVHQATGQPLADIVLARGLITRDGLLVAVAKGLGFQFSKIAQSEFSPELLGALSPELARGYGAFPHHAESHLLEVWATDPFNTQVVDDLGFALGKEVRLVVADPDEVRKLVERCYGEGASSLEDLLTSIDIRHYEQGAAAETDLAERDLEAMAGQAPIIHFVNLVLTQAIRDKASDIHFEPFEHEFRIRYRIDGALYEMTPPPRQLALPIASRLKVMANLNIAERRVAQDGRIQFTLAGQGARTVDLRVSTLPTQFGESIVLRVLDRAAVQLDLSQLGLPIRIHDALSEIIRRPNGILIVTGPTGSGKTTTLYAALRTINTTEAKLLSVEDPVEYEIDGIMQVPVNAPIGLTFASALRAFLRQDPDVIMVGEIRDLATAQVAIQAALTGHLVFSTLHTNDAAGAITRLVDMGVEPFLISSTVSAVLAQRLLRRICPHCKTSYQPSTELLASEGIDPRAVAGRPFYRGRGCSHCHNTGYLGRLGIFEWLPMSEEICEQVLMREPTLVLHKTAIAQGMFTLREDGLRAALDGETTLDELLRYT